MFEGFSRRRIAVREVEINCVVGGSGPALLLLHGYPQCLEQWAPVAERLTGTDGFYLNAMRRAG